MRRVVLDTNVLASALLTHKGNAAVILGMITDELLLPVFCWKILDEYENVLLRQRFGFPRNLVAETLSLFDILGVAVELKKSAIHMLDEYDRIFYDTAVSGAAELITGNLRHYPKKCFVISPAAFFHPLH